MVSKLTGNAVVGQSGGPTAVINQSLAGVIAEVGEHDCFKTLLGAVHGVRGIIGENFVDLTTMSRHDLEDVANTPSAALGSTRDKPDEEYCNRIFEVFKKRDVRYFFYIGGNDSAGTANVVDELAQKAGYELNVFHIPKTIDNDLLVTDHCPGYGSAAKFVIHAVTGDDLDNRSLKGVKIDVVMGRNAGFLAASAMLARRRADDGPHLIYVPERGISMEQFASDVAEVYGRLGRCVVVASEGICDPGGVLWARRIQQGLASDGFGNIQLSGSGALGDFLVSAVKKVLPDARLRSDTFGYLQRCFPGIVSRVDADEARCCGRMAVQYAAGGDTAGSVALRRVGGADGYRAETFLTALESVAIKTKSLPAEYINDAGNDITEAYRDYLSPLVGDLPVVGHLPI